MAATTAVFITCVIMVVRFRSHQRSRQEAPYRQFRIRFASRHNLNATEGQATLEPFASATGNQYIHVIERVRLPIIKAMDSQLLGQVKLVDQADRLGVIDPENEEATGMSGVSGHATKILACDCDLHGFS